MKQGGNSWNSAWRSKTGVTSRSKCTHCGRGYKMEHAKKAHESSCKTYQEGRLQQ